MPVRKWDWKGVMATGRRTPRRTPTPRRRKFTPRATPSRRTRTPGRSFARRGGRRIMTRSTGSKGGTPGTHPFVLAQIDPFSNKALGVRVPDQSTAYSSSFHTSDQVAITNAVAGFADAMLFLPNCKVNAVQLTPASATAITIPAGYAGGGGLIPPSRSASIIASYSLVRAVSHGVKLTTSVAPQNAQGFVHTVVFPISQYNASTFEAPVNVSQLVDLPGYTRTPLASLINKPLIVVNRFCGPDSFVYQDPDDNQLIDKAKLELDVANGWCVIFVMLTGAYSAAAPSNQLSIEMIAHFEGIGIFGSLSGGQSAETPNATAMDQGSTVAANAPATRSAGSSRYTEFSVEAGGSVSSARAPSAPAPNSRAAARSMQVMSNARFW